MPKPVLTHRFKYHSTGVTKFKKGTPVKFIFKTLAQKFSMFVRACFGKMWHAL